MLPGIQFITNNKCELGLDNTDVKVSNYVVFRYVPNSANLRKEHE